MFQDISQTMDNTIFQVYFKEIQPYKPESTLVILFEGNIKDNYKSHQPCKTRTNARLLTVMAAFLN